MTMIAVVGGNGQLGTDIVATFRKRGDNVMPLTHADLDISSLEDTRTVLKDIRPSVIINTAAMHHVENCERDPVRAHEINAQGPRNLATVSNELDSKLMHVSTDYVFDGLKNAPYLEEDPTTPLNVYGKTKLDGEAAVRETTAKHFVMRTSALYGQNPCRAKGGKNFVDLMLKLAGERDELRVVNDEIVSPTSTAELAHQIAELSCTDCYGLYHATSEGFCSWYEFAAAIFDMTHKKVDLKIAAPNEFPAKVPRPKYSVLENHALKKIGLNVFTNWQEGLGLYLSRPAART